MNIHPTAIVDSDAQLGEGVEIKPFTIIEAGVEIGDNCTVGPQAVIRTGTIIHANSHVHTGAVLGEPPQDAKFQGEPSKLVIGPDNIIREYVTMHRATGEDAETSMGTGNMLMAFSHVGHNAHIGNNTLIGHNSALAGHVVIEDYANLGGFAAFHQYVTVGTMAMVGGMSRIVRDVPPYTTVVGNPAEVRSINWRGLKRRGISQDERAIIKRAFRLLYRSEHNTSDAIAIIERELPKTDEIEYLTAFLKRIDDGYAGRQINPH
jgi:UDP-N-acetylglucosamine acyltransferase